MAGCSLSTSLARAYLNPILASLPPMQGYISSEHVDDISQISIHQREDEATSMAIRQGIKLAEAISDRQLTISDKSVVVSNRFSAAKRVASRISAAGVPGEAVN